MSGNLRPLQLTQRELQLLLKYGYPSPEDVEPLCASPLRNGVHRAQVDAFWISMWIADIVRSAKEIRSQSLLDELDALCDVLENAERHDSRLRGTALE
jgi:hypothetical protein